MTALVYLSPSNKLFNGFRPLLSLFPSSLFLKDLVRSKYLTCREVGLRIDPAWRPERSKKQDAKERTRQQHFNCTRLVMKAANENELQRTFFISSFPSSSSKFVFLFLIFPLDDYLD